MIGIGSYAISVGQLKCGSDAVLSCFAILVVLTLVRAEAPPDSGNREGVIVPGIYIEELEDLPLHFYEKLVPIVFEFKMYPELSTTSSTVSTEPRILPRFLCRNDGKYVPSTNWLFTCPIVYHLSALISQLKANMTDISPSPLNRIPSGRYSVENKKFVNPNLVFEECDALLRTEPWLGITVRDAGLADYKTLIEKCAMASYFEEEITEFNATVNGTLYEKMRENFMLNYVNYSATEGAETAGMLLGLQSLMTLQSYAEITRWREAILDCKNNHIPYSLIKYARLDQALQSLRTQFTTQKSTYVPVISSVMSMYQQPIADCIIGSNSLFVRILVPVKKAASVYKPLKIIQPQFFYNDELCTVTSRSTRLSSLRFIHEKTSKVIFETSCDFSKGGICRIPATTNRAPGDKCINSIGNAVEKSGSQETIDSIKNSCGIECEQRVSRSDSRLPLVQRVGSNKFLVTTNTITTLLIKSEGKPDEMVLPEKYGAMEVTLPCSSYLMLHSDKHFPTKPCGTMQNLPIVHHALPIHMINSTFGFPFMRPGLLSARTSSYYSSRYTLLNLSKYVNMTFREQDVKEVQLGIENPLSMEMESIEDLAASRAGPEPMNHSLVRPCCTDTLPGSANGEQTSLWILLVFQMLLTIFICSFLFYKIALLNRKLETSRNAISFSALQSTSQMTLADK